MRMLRSPALAVAALALASVATPSFAGSLYYDQMGTPMGADQADMVASQRMMMMDGQPRRMGQFKCSPMEKRTRLQRQACGATKTMN